MRVEHPDTALVADVVADLAAWLDRPVHDATSAVTGGGAVRAAEERFAALHHGRRSLVLPSATYGMYAALLGVGVTPGDLVLVPAVDWLATVSAVRAVGAEPVPVEVDAASGTVDPNGVASVLAAITGAGTAAVSAVVVCHLHGVAADVPGVRAVVGPGIPIIEDCAQSLGATWDGEPVGTFGDFSVFSFGPAKAIDVGEAAIVTAADADRHDRLIELTAHPVRQTLAGLDASGPDGFSMRVAPVPAIRLAMKLARWRPALARARHAWLRERVAVAAPGMTVLGRDARRGSAALAVPVRGLLTDWSDSAMTGVPSGALVIPEWIAGRTEHADVTLVRPREMAAARRCPDLTSGGW